MKLQQKHASHRRWCMRMSCQEQTPKAPIMTSLMRPDGTFEDFSADFLKTLPDVKYLFVLCLYFANVRSSYAIATASLGH